MRLRATGTAVALALVLAFPALAHAQTGTVTGTVTNENGVVVQQAQISVFAAEGVGTLADDNGVYRLSLPAGTHTLIVEHVAHAQTEIDVSVTAGQTTTLDIQILTKAAELTGGGIQVTVDRNQPGAGGRVIEAAATTDVVTGIKITERSTFNTADHLRGSPGVDVITTGLQNSNVVVRGFNNIFSGALHMLSDYRLAGVPSLRVNLMHFIPTIDEDIDRMEVVLGPGSALYGPNTANGVVHILSKSPLDYQGTTVTVGTGIKGSENSPSAVQTSFRSAFLVNENFGLKVSGQYLNAEEWFNRDPAELAGQEFADANPTLCQADKAARGLSFSEAVTACSRIGDRDFDIERWSVEARADYRFADDGTVVATFGRNNSDGIELTGLGAGQTRDWEYDFYQARVSKARFFAQGYYNTSNSGNSFLLQDGVTLVDESSLLVGQVQHGIAIADGRQDFTYGFDYFRTSPASAGRIYGSYEDEDEMTEWGAYVQSKTALSPQVDLIVAGRMDSHSVLEDMVFSPRAALVFKPDENNGFRVTYNSAFSTPTALNFFLDVAGGFAPDPLGTLGFTTRAYGSGTDGWSLRDGNGTFQMMRSPFTPAGSGGAAQLVPADVGLLWQYYVGVLAQSGGIDAATAALLGSLTPSSDADIARLAWDPSVEGAAGFQPLLGLDLQDIPPTVESNTETFEVGWTGVINNRLSVSADVYYTKKNDFVSPLLVQTPLIVLDPASMNAYLTAALTPVLGAAGAAAAAASISAGAGTPTNPVPIPLGVVSSDAVGAQGADLILSYRNVGDIDLWGGDIAVQAFLTNRWSVSGTWSHVSEDSFPLGDGTSIALNAPTDKGSVGLAFRDLAKGANASARVRFTSSFPASSAGFTGDVASATIVDVTAGLRLPNTRATLQLSISNLLNDTYQSFVGVPEVGRFTMLRLKYDIF